MSGNNGKKQYPDNNPADYKRYNLTELDNYEFDYELSWINKIEKIMEIPSIDNMPGVFVRGIFKNDRSLNAHLRLMYRHKKFNDTGHQELLRAKIAGTAAIGGVGRLDGLFAAVNLIAPDMYRTARGMPKLRKGEKEEVHRGSDFREKERSENSGGGL